MSPRNASRPPPSRPPRADLQESFEQYARGLCALIAQGRSNEDELRAATAQLGSYAADLRRLVQEGQRGIETVQSACVEILEGFLCASLAREECALRHANATERYAVLFARELGLGDSEEQRVGRAARLHDVGKVALPEGLLGKHGKLDAGERAALREHCAPGAAFVRASASRDLEQIGDAIRCHHENWDGSGYPHGLAGDEIPLVARIVKLADAYDTLRDSRCYKPALSHADACRAILDGTALDPEARVDPRHFDPRLLDRFSDLQRRLDALSSGGGPGGA